MSPTGHRVCNPGMCSDQESNLWVHRSMLKPMSHVVCLFLDKFLICMYCSLMSIRFKKLGLHYLHSLKVKNKSRISCRIQFIPLKKQSSQLLEHTVPHISGLFIQNILSRSEQVGNAFFPSNPSCKVNYLTKDQGNHCDLISKSLEPCRGWENRWILSALGDRGD